MEHFRLMPIMNAFKSCRNHPATIARTILAVSAMASSIYVMIDGDRPWAEDEMRKMLVKSHRLSETRF